MSEDAQPEQGWQIETSADAEVVPGEEAPLVDEGDAEDGALEDAAAEEGAEYPAGEDEQPSEPTP